MAEGRVRICFACNSPHLKVREISLGIFSPLTSDLFPILIAHKFRG